MSDIGGRKVSKRRDDLDDSEGQGDALYIFTFYARFPILTLGVAGRS